MKQPFHYDSSMLRKMMREFQAHLIQANTDGMLVDITCKAMGRYKLPVITLYSVQCYNPWNQYLEQAMTCQLSIYTTKSILNKKAGTSLEVHWRSKQNNNM